MPKRKAKKKLDPSAYATASVPKSKPVEKEEPVEAAARPKAVPAASRPPPAAKGSKDPWSSSSPSHAPSPAAYTGPSPLDLLQEAVKRERGGALVFQNGTLRLRGAKGLSEIDQCLLGPRASREAEEIRAKDVDLAALRALALRSDADGAHRRLSPALRQLWSLLRDEEAQRQREGDAAAAEEEERRKAAEEELLRREMRPVVHMAEAVRARAARIVADARKARGETGGEEEEEEEDGVDRDVVAARTGPWRAYRRLLALGFHPSLVGKRVRAHADSLADSGAVDLSAIVHDMTLEVDEEQLPKGFEAARDVQVVLHRGDATAGGKRSMYGALDNAARRLFNYGFPRASVHRAALDVGGDGDERAALHHLHRQLVMELRGRHASIAQTVDAWEARIETRLEARARALFEAKQAADEDAAAAMESLGFAMVDDEEEEEEEKDGEKDDAERVFVWNETTRDAFIAEHVVAARQAERERLAATLGSDFLDGKALLKVAVPLEGADEDEEVWRVRVRVPKQPGTATLELRFPSGCLYPFDCPDVHILHSDLPQFAALAAASNLTLHCDELLGEEPFVPAMVEWIRAHFADITTKPFVVADDDVVDAENAPEAAVVHLRSVHAMADPPVGPRGQRGGKRGEQAPAALQGSNEELRAELEAKQNEEGYRRMLGTRSKLPVYAYRKQVADVVRENAVTVISGETGSGKTTQIPQFILDDAIERGEGAACNIICTQPRRISATSVAARVADERNEPLGRTVGYQIRLESKTSRRTRLTFCTTGVLLRRLIRHPALDGVSCIVVDEIHERGVDSDFLLIILRRLIARRPDIRIVLMSATLNAELFSSYFHGCPVMAIPGRTFPVDVNYLEDVMELLVQDGHVLETLIDAKARQLAKRRAQTAAATDTNAIRDPTAADLRYLTDESNPRGRRYAQRTVELLPKFDDDVIDYKLLEALVFHIHNVHLPEDGGNGAILVFLPGLAEIMTLFRRLNRPTVRKGGKGKAAQARSGDDDVADDILADDEDDEDDESEDEEAVASSQLLVLPLHGSLSNDEQRRVFNRPPAGLRKVVLSTNIAETSVTIDDIVYVVDVGRLKETQYDPVKRHSVLAETWVSQANARQRSGRAGRVQAGICYRLFSRARFNACLQDQQTPEMLRVPLEQLSLQIRVMDFGLVQDFLGEAIEPPDAVRTTAAVEDLVQVGALADAERQQLTALGFHLASLPTDVRIGKMLIYGVVYQCIDAVATMAAVMTYKSPFTSSVEKRDQARAAYMRFAAGQSDHLSVLKAYRAWQDARAHGKRTERAFCNDNWLSMATLEMIADLKRDFVELLSSTRFLDKGLTRRRVQQIGRQAGNGSDGVWEATGAAANANDGKPGVLKAVLCTGLYPNVALVRRPRTTYHMVSGGTAVSKVAARDLKFSLADGDRVHMHPGSINFTRGDYDWPFLVFHEKVATSKLFLRDTSSVSAYVLLLTGGEISVTADKQLATVDGWLEMTIPGRVAVLVHALRQELDGLLERKVRHPELSLAGNPLADIICHLVHRSGHE